MKKFNLKKQYFVLLGVALLFNSCMSLKKSVETYESSGNMIDIEKSQELFENFNDSTRGSTETQSVWISLEELKSYIALLENVEKKNNKPISGISIFYGKYEANKNLANDKKNRLVPRFGNYKNRETVFLNPTFRVNDVGITQEILRHKPFYITPNNSSATGENRYIGTYTPIEYNSENNSARKLISKTTIIRTSLNLNELNAIPPKL